MNSFSSPLVVMGLFLLNLDLVNAHGRLTTPMTRFGPGYENDPVSGYTGSDFVCRNPAKTPETTLTAGGTLDLVWELTAAHVGDCAVYISYDYEKDNAEQQYFKIANLPDCKSFNGETVTIDLPEWLPSGRGILRWDWYALHQYPATEFYAQCVDVEITGGSPVSKSDITMYSIISPALYPANGQTGVGYRDPWNAGEQYVTGPACARGYTENDCDLTAAGTTGHIDVGGSVFTPSPTTPGTPSPSTPAPVASPIQNPTPSPTQQGDSPTAEPTSVNPSPVSTEKFYFGTDTDAGLKMTLTAIAGFLAQTGWESGGDAPFGYCDENNWSESPTASCTQRADGQLYSSLTGEGACAVTNDMTMTAETHASWSVPMECTPGTATETCCWWGRGAIQTTGPYNYGKLQSDVVSKMGLGVDLCTNPEAICQHDELAWIGGFYYWVTAVQGDNSNCFQPTLEAYGADWDSPSTVANCAAFEDGIGGAINNGAWNVQAHSNSARLDYFDQFLAAMKTGYTDTSAGQYGSSEYCTGNDKVDRILAVGAVKTLAVSDAVANTMDNSAYSFDGFCEGLRTFLDAQGSPTLSPTELVSPTPQPTTVANVVTPSPTSSPTNVVTPSPTSSPTNVVTPSPTSSPTSNVVPPGPTPSPTSNNVTPFPTSSPTSNNVTPFPTSAPTSQDLETCTCTNGMELTITHGLGFDELANFLENGSEPKPVTEQADFWPYLIGGVIASVLLLCFQVAAYLIHRRRTKKSHNSLNTPLSPSKPKLSDQWMSSAQYDPHGTEGGPRASTVV